ncbi:N-acetylgalactosamine kinase [Micractinium conductrix]|uniref:N-acetylgalactosamine kinase n=1 Tax=Micractinium conductrix TaxID=554055 RepID=A0A2P6VGE9_9CHLO|nr:N-acetylgalactosamine kinase [Micractinium conductrix]|eukprot:PSC73153.1 N-acetylgalactosamine kinase [Micractinium conductrix]
MSVAEQGFRKLGRYKFSFRYMTPRGLQTIYAAAGSADGHLNCFNPFAQMVGLTARRGAGAKLASELRALVAQIPEEQHGRIAHSADVVKNHLDSSGSRIRPQAEGVEFVVDDCFSIDTDIYSCGLLLTALLGNALAGVAGLSRWCDGGAWKVSSKGVGLSAEALQAVEAFDTNLLQLLHDLHSTHELHLGGPLLKRFALVLCWAAIIHLAEYALANPMIGMASAAGGYFMPPPAITGGAMKAAIALSEMQHRQEMCLQFDALQGGRAIYPDYYAENIQLRDSCMAGVLGGVTTKKHVHLEDIDLNAFNSNHGFKSLWGEALHYKKAAALKNAVHAALTTGCPSAGIHVPLCAALGGGKMRKVTPSTLQQLEGMSRTLSCLDIPWEQFCPFTTYAGAANNLAASPPRPAIPKWAPAAAPEAAAADGDAMEDDDKENTASQSAADRNKRHRC